MAIEDVEQRIIEPRRMGESLSIAELNERLPHPLPPRLADILAQAPGPMMLGTCRVKALEEMAFLPDGDVSVETILGRNAGAIGLSKLHDRYRTRVREGLVPIADTHGGADIFFLDMSEGSDGPVFFWWHEAPGPENGRESLCLVGRDLDEFLDGINPVS